MFVVTSPFNLHLDAAPPVSPTHADQRGGAEIAFERRGGETRLAHLHQKEPLRVLFPAPPKGELPAAALANIGGGLVGGDGLDVEFRVGPGAAAMIHAQAAEKVYRSAGADAEIQVRLQAEPEAWLEYLPQETILFEGARLRRVTRVDADATARFMAGEILVFGRIARGERLTTGLVHEAWEVRLDGRLAWTEALRLDGAIDALLDDAYAFAGAAATATVVCRGGDIETARACLAERDGVRAAATEVGGVIVVRWIGADAAGLRASFGTFWASYRHATAALPAKLPRLWHI